MKIELELSEAVIEEAAQKAWRALFAAPHYAGGSGAEGWEAIKKQASLALLKLDASEVIQTTVKQMLPLIVRDVVSQELKKLLTAEMKAQIKANQIPVKDGESTLT